MSVAYTVASGQFVATASAIAPLPAPTSATMTWRSLRDSIWSSTASTNSSVSGRGINTRRFHVQLQPVELTLADQIRNRFGGGAPRNQL